MGLYTSNVLVRRSCFMCGYKFLEWFII